MSHAVSAAAAATESTAVATSAAVSAARKLVLVQVDHRPDELVRRYRLARLTLDGRAGDRERFAYLKRTYD